MINFNVEDNETYETRNASLWILNDEGLYNMARQYRRYTNPYKRFIDDLKEIGGDIALQTPDGVAWNDSSIDIEEMDKLIEEL